MKVIDTSGTRCPQPIIETKKALNESKDGEVFLVIIDNPTSFKNVTRFLDDNKVKFAATEENGKWILSINSEKGSVITSKAEDYCEVDLPSGKGTGYGIAISSEIMGSGDDELGRRLMRSFFVTVSCMDQAPLVIAFYNSGVKLLAYDRDIIEAVREMEHKSTEILICGTCVDHYNIGKDIRTGRVADMFTIITRLEATGNIIRP
jgi:selenium metabolism protein YedF